jgi:hypothetical protein
VSTLAAPVTHWRGCRRLRTVLVTAGRTGRDRRHHRTLLACHRNRGHHGQEEYGKRFGAELVHPDDSMPKSSHEIRSRTTPFRLGFCPVRHRILDGAPACRLLQCVLGRVKRILWIAHDTPAFVKAKSRPFSIDSATCGKSCCQLSDHLSGYRPPSLTTGKTALEKHPAPHLDNGSARA